MYVFPHRSPLFVAFSVDFQDKVDPTLVVDVKVNQYIRRTQMEKAKRQMHMMSGGDGWNKRRNNNAYRSVFF